MPTTGHTHYRAHPLPRHTHYWAHPLPGTPTTGHAHYWHAHSQMGLFWRRNPCRSYQQTFLPWFQSSRHRASHSKHHPCYIHRDDPQHQVCRLLVHQERNHSLSMIHIFETVVRMFCATIPLFYMWHPTFFVFCPIKKHVSALFMSYYPLVIHLHSPCN